MTREGRTLADAEDLARRVQADILAGTGLTCSAGVSVNKFLAEVAASLLTPDLLAGRGVRLPGVSVTHLVRRGEARGGEPQRFLPAL